jgi:hypothetical protein
MSLQLHRPDGQGGLERRTVADQNWRRQLRSQRWGKSLPGGHLPALNNTEMNPTRTIVSVGFWLSLAALTFVLLLLGYGTGFWH